MHFMLAGVLVSHFSSYLATRQPLAPPRLVSHDSPTANPGSAPFRSAVRQGVSIDEATGLENVYARSSQPSLQRRANDSLRHQPKARLLECLHQSVAPTARTRPRPGPRPRTNPALTVCPLLAGGFLVRTVDFAPFVVTTVSATLLQTFRTRRASKLFNSNLTAQLVFVAGFYFLIAMAFLSQVHRTGRVTASQGVLGFTWADFFLAGGGG